MSTEELYGQELREAMERHYPGLSDWIEASVHCVYGALAFAHQLEEQTGTASATGLWLRREWAKRHGGGLQTYDKHIDQFARFVDFASHDAWLSEYLAQNRIELDDVTQCPACGDLVGLGCQCEGGD